MTLKELAPYLAYNLKFTKITYNPNYSPVETLDCNSIQSCEEGNVMYHMHPLSDLTKPCLEGGGVPIVELAKLAYTKVDQIHLNGRICFIDSREAYVFGYVNAEDSFICTYIPENRNCFVNCQLSLFNWLFEHHFWLGDQDRFGKDIIDVNTLK